MLIFLGSSSLSPSQEILHFYGNRKVIIWKITALWDVTPCILVGKYRRFWETCCFQHLPCWFKSQIPLKCHCVSTRLDCVTRQKPVILNVSALKAINVFMIVVTRVHQWILSWDFEFKFCVSSMEKNPSWKLQSRWAVQEFPRHFYNLCFSTVFLKTLQSCDIVANITYWLSSRKHSTTRDGSSASRLAKQCYKLLHSV